MAAGKGFVAVAAVSASIFGVAVCIKSYIGPPNYTGKERLSGKTVIITGASSGIGAKLAYETAQRGANLIMAAKNLRQCKDHMFRVIDHTHNRKVSCHELDLSSQASIRRFVEEVASQEKKVDLLVNNAAVMCPLNREVTEESIEKQFGVNFIGSYLLTNLLLDHLKASPEGRIVMLTCQEYAKGQIDFKDLNFDFNYKPEAAYAQSQLAKVLFSQDLAHSLRDTNVTVFMVDPGLTNTNIRRHFPYNNNIVSRGIMEIVNWVLLRPVSQSVGSVLYCSLSQELGKEQSGNLIRDFKVIDLHAAAKDPVLAKRVSSVGAKWTNLSETNNKTSNPT